MKHFKKSSSKFLNGLNKLFKQKYLLYVLVVISLVYLFLLLQSRNFYAIYFFILLGIIIYCYTKNMSILLTICLIFTAIIFPLKSSKEGMKSKKSKDKKEKLTNNSIDNGNGTITTAGGTVIGDDTVKNATSANITDGTEESTLQGKKSNISTEVAASGGGQETFTGKLANQSRIDPAATMNKAFNNLEGMLGNDGIKNLTNDTEQLISNQTKLFKTIENMTPLIEKASSIMSKMNF